ncbi:MAG: LamG-like jellyroll fold domain-containing protein [Verrucomicrobiota bacterium]
MSSPNDELLCRYLDEDLPSGEQERLQNLLEESSEARTRLRLFATISEALPEFARETQPAEPASKVVRFPALQTALPWVIATAACLVALFAITRRTSESSSPAPPPVVALLVDEAGAIFREGRDPDTVRFDTGSYHLDSGAIHVRFSNGADLVMKGPASFNIDDAFHVRLNHGAVRAIVPPSAHGFTVATPGVDYEDLGTEFGVQVDEATGASELHVFSGQVDAKEPGTLELLSSVLDGESVQFANGKLTPISAPDGDLFPTPGSISYLRWKNSIQDFADDKNLIAYFPFRRSDDPKRLRNLASSAVVSDGEIHGARWVSGRWPDKQGLLFDRNTDYVEIEIPGEFDELSFATWMKIDRFDFSHISILDSNGWTDGDIHWQFNRSGTMWIATYKVGRQVAPPRTIIPTGQWIHVAATISKKSGRSRVFLNGNLAGAIELHPESLIEPGLSRIGNWLLGDEWPHVPIRAFRGRMDEFAIWNRELTEDELRELVNQGKPTELWSLQPE